jgi:hypothetical protein
MIVLSIKYLLLYRIKSFCHQKNELSKEKRYYIGEIVATLPAGSGEDLPTIPSERDLDKRGLRNDP